MKTVHLNAPMKTLGWDRGIHLPTSPYAVSRRPIGVPESARVFAITQVQVKRSIIPIDTTQQVIHGVS